MSGVGVLSERILPRSKLRLVASFELQDGCRRLHINATSRGSVFDWTVFPDVFLERLRVQHQVDFLDTQQSQRIVAGAIQLDCCGMVVVLRVRAAVA